MREGTREDVVYGVSHHLGSFASPFQCTGISKTAAFAACPFISCVVSVLLCLCGDGRAHVRLCRFYCPLSEYECIRSLHSALRS